MRSRYSAYVMQREAYLLATWDKRTCPPSLDLVSDTDTRWLGLEIKRQQTTGPDRANVEFVARYKIGARAHRLHEISHFIREDGLWYYVDGDFPG